MCISGFTTVKNELWVVDRETGTKIERVKTFSDGAEIIKKFEEEDKLDGNYEPNFYSIMEIEKLN